MTNFLDLLLGHLQSRVWVFPKMLTAKAPQTALLLASFRLTWQMNIQQASFDDSLHINLHMDPYGNIYGVQPVATLRLHRRVRSCTKNGGQVTGSGDWYVWQSTQQQNTSYGQPWLFLIFTWYILSRNWVFQYMFQCCFGRLIIDPHFLIFSHWNSHRLNGIQPISEDKPDFHGCEHGFLTALSPEKIACRLRSLGGRL